MEHTEKLHRAIQIGSLEEVRRQVGLGANMDHVLGMRGTALCAAIEARDVAIARYLIQAGCSVNTPDYDSEPPLLLAIRKEKQRSISLREESLDCAKLLICTGKCDLDKVDPLTKKTAIHFATEQRMVDVVKWLMNAGCDINKLDQNGNMPLHLALYDGYHEIVTLLVADPACIIKGCNKAGLIPLHICANNGDLQSMNIILESMRKKTHVSNDTFGICPVRNTELSVYVNSVTFYEKDTSVHIAVRNGHGELLKVLVEQGADVNVRNSLSQLPLILACSHSTRGKHTDNTIPSLLLKHGANPNVLGTLIGTARSSFREAELEVTPLIMSVMSKNIELTKVLVQHGADINMTDNMGQTPLMLALLKNSIEVAKYLLNEFGGKGLIVNGVNAHGDTCLHAVSKCYFKDKAGAVADLTRSLLRAGAEQTENSVGESPVMTAFNSESLEVLDTLLEEDPSVQVIDGGAHLPAMDGDANLPVMDGNINLLSLSVALGQLDTVRVLLSHGADINQRTDSGESLLYVTIYNEELVLAKYLVDNGCNLSNESYIFQQFDDSKRHRHGADKSDDDSYDDSSDNDEDAASESETELCALKENVEFRNWLQKTASSPRSLKLSCLIVTRHHFTEQNIPFKKMDCLPLPMKLRMALRFKDG